MANSVPSWRCFAVAGLLGLVTACGPAPADADAAGGHDAADVSFAQAMVPHHAQAIAMAKLATTRAFSAQVKEIASQISAEQLPEIAQMQWMLADWGKPPAPTEPMPDVASTAGMPGMASDTPGMMTEQQMAQLRAATGPAFDRAFLQMMIAHHQGGVAMARTELAHGRDPDALQMAENISDAQLLGIQVMQQVLAAA